MSLPGATVRRGALALRGPLALRAALARMGVAALLAALTAGCLPAQASYSFGVSTSEIVGQLDLSDLPAGAPAAPAAPLILVYKYHYTFIQMEPGEVLTHPTASLAAVRPDGSFAIAVPVDVVALEVFFIAPDHLTDLFQFHKQVGIGRIVYRASLPAMPDWRSHFYTYLAPELEHVIVESRYGLPPHDQATLSAWLDGQRKRLASEQERRDAARKAREAS